MPNFPPDAGHQPSPADKADMLYHDYLAGGPDAAYKSLKQDYDNSTGMRNRDEYFGQVANQLMDAGHMSNIAISWVRDNKDRLDTNGDGAVDRREMQDAANGGGLDGIFGRVVLTRVPSPDDDRTFFDQIAHTKKVWNVDPNSIEDADLRKYGRQMHRAERRDYDQEETIKAAAPLLANHGELLAVLDTGPNGERNNFISGREMNKFLNDYRENMGKGVYTAANAEYVSELLHGTVGRVSSHPFHGFSVNALMRRAGLSEEDLADSRFDAPHEPTKPTPNKTEKDQSTGAPGDKQQTKVEETQAEKFPNMELELRKHVDSLSRVQPGEGYNAVAARLLNIFPGHPRTAEEIKEITILGRQIQKLNGDHSTYKLHAGVILPVGSNLDLLLDENPAFRRAMEQKKQVYMENFSRHAKQAVSNNQTTDSSVYDD